MRRVEAWARHALPFLLLVAAVCLCGWAFLRSERFHEKADVNYTQNYEIQWRTSQIREHLARIHGDLRLAVATGQRVEELRRDVFLLNANVSQLLRLEYTPRFLRERDIELLRGFQSIVRSQFAPLLDGSREYERALQAMPDLEKRMFEVSGTAVAHAEALNAATHIDTAMSRNRFLFAVALSVVAAGFAINHYRSFFARRRDQHLRSFSTLYAHMTRGRVAALRLFLDYQDKSTVQHPEMLVAAREAAQQLEIITNGLNTIVYADCDLRREELATIVESATLGRQLKPSCSISDEAGRSTVPSTQMRLLLDELLQNAEAAVGESPTADIRIVAKVEATKFRGRRKLLVEVIDNGHGMPPDVLSKATLPFYSTRSGHHTGLGLPGCAQMVSALKGRLSIRSRVARGTSVQIALPI